MSGTVIVVDYGAGNLRSAAKALGAAGAHDVMVTGEPTEIARAAHIVLPGVGAFAQCIGALRNAPGVVAALETAVLGRGVPFLGICVGMQLLASEGHEHGVHAGLGWVPGVVERLAPGAGQLKIPHSGWNDVTPVPGSGVAAGSAYFVHSYRFVPRDAADVAATADYGQTIAAVVRRGAVTGVQFHPEKSQAYGLAFLRNWLGPA